MWHTSHFESIVLIWFILISNLHVRLCKWSETNDKPHMIYLSVEQIILNYSLKIGRAKLMLDYCVTIKIRTFVCIVRNQFCRMWFSVLFIQYFFVRQIKHTHHTHTHSRIASHRIASFLSQIAFDLNRHSMN